MKWLFKPVISLTNNASQSSGAETRDQFLQYNRYMSNMCTIFQSPDFITNN